MTAPAGDTSESKAKLRARLRGARLALSPRQRALAARRAAKRLLSLRTLRHCRRWAIYLAMGAELDTAPLAQALHRRGATVVVPVVCAGHRLRWVRWHPTLPMMRAEHGILRPRRSRPRCRVGQLQVMVLPLVGFDRHGTRLGAGGGYYDRIPARISHRPLRVGYGYALQAVDALPRDPWDVPLDLVVTERSTLWPTG